MAIGLTVGISYDLTVAKHCGAELDMSDLGTLMYGNGKCLILMTNMRPGSISLPMQLRVQVFLWEETT